MNPSIASEPRLMRPRDADVKLAEVRPLHASSVQPLDASENRLAPWVLAAVDIACVQAAVLLFHVLRAAALSLWHGVPAGLPDHGLRLALLLIPVDCWLAGLYPGYGLTPVERLRKRLNATAIAFGALLAWDFLAHQNADSRVVVVATFVTVAVLSPVIESLTIAILLRLKCWGTPVIILDSEEGGSAVAGTLRRLPQLGLEPVGILKQDPATWGTLDHDTPVLGPPSRAREFARCATTAVVAMSDVSRRSLSRTVESLPFARIIVVPQLSGIQTLWLTTRDFGGALGVELQNNLLRKRYYYAKRCLDFALSVPVLMIAAPVVAVLALWVKLVSAGPAFYAQERVGFHGRPIRVWKLRTMYPNAEGMLHHHLAAHPEEKREWERFFKLKQDPRILPGVGRFLRATSLDELPQLWNVLRGDLSLVGPRPFPKYHVRAFDDDFRRLRHSVVPGVTGLWQVSARSNADLAEQERLDTYYIRNWSPWLDLHILARTIGVVLLGRGY